MSRTRSRTAAQRMAAARRTSAKEGSAADPPPVPMLGTGGSRAGDAEQGGQGGVDLRDAVEQRTSAYSTSAVVAALLFGITAAFSGEYSVSRACVVPAFS